MLVPLSWLRDFAPFGEAQNLVGVLDGLGLVVEGVEEVGRGLEDIVVVRVVRIDPIEGADRIRKILVDAGGGSESQIVCGAWNFEVGDLVPLAPVGTVLPGGMEIGRRKMKGVASDGMLCSGTELELSTDSSGLLVLGKELRGAEPGTPLVEALHLERDSVFDIAVEANRPDAMCIAGIARDLAAKLHLGFSMPDPPAPRVAGAAGSAGGTGPEAHVEVPDPDLCPRFTATVLSGFALGASPSDISRRLVLAGMRPVNNVVDASNYVMLELGQPTHPYDLDRVARATLRARVARRGETLETLDGSERTMGVRSVGPGDDLRDCLICDGDDVPIGIGGVMGGASTEISDETRNVLLEAAYFLPMAIARTSARLGLRTEASVRFERGCDPGGIDRSVARLCEVLARSAGPEFVVHGGAIDVRGNIARPLEVTLRTARLNSVLSSELDEAAVTAYLEPIGFESSQAGPGVLEVRVPTFRPDVTREIDVIEEVARHHGYEALPKKMRPTPHVGALTERQRLRRALRDALAHTGAHEAWTPSLVNPAESERSGLGPEVVSVANPLTPEESALRRSLLPGLLKAVAFNLNRRQAGLRLFEVGNVFALPEEERIATSLAHEDPYVSVLDEREFAAVVLAGVDDDARTASRSWSVVAEALGIEGVAVAQSAPDGSGGIWGSGLHPTRSARLVTSSAGGRQTVVGEVGEVDTEVLEGFGIDPSRGRVGWIQFDVGLVLEAAPRRSTLMEPVSRFPSADIDLAFLVPDTASASDVGKTIGAAGGQLLERVWLFDVFRGEGMSEERSLAFRLRFCALDRTLTDGDVAALRSACIAAVEEAHGARLRG